MTGQKKKPLDEERGEDSWGMGADADGVVHVLSPEEARRRMIERNAEEATYDDDVEEEGDFSDLEDEVEGKTKNGGEKP